MNALVSWKRYPPAWQIENIPYAFRFSDHLEIMFSSEAVPWDIDNKYQSSQLEVCTSTLVLFGALPYISIVPLECRFIHNNF